MPPDLHKFSGDGLAEARVLLPLPRD